MATYTIPKDFGQGGKGLAGGNLGSDAKCPTLKEILYGLIDDIAGINIAALAADGSTAIAAADAAAVAAVPAAISGGESPTEAEHNAVITWVTDMKDKWDAGVTLMNELKTDFNALRTTVSDLRTKLTTTQTYTKTVAKES